MNIELKIIELIKEIQQGETIELSSLNTYLELKSQKDFNNNFEMRIKEVIEDKLMSVKPFIKEKMVAAFSKMFFKIEAGSKIEKVFKNLEDMKSFILIKYKTRSGIDKTKIFSGAYEEVVDKGFCKMNKQDLFFIRLCNLEDTTDALDLEEQIFVIEDLANEFNLDPMIYDRSEREYRLASLIEMHDCKANWKGNNKVIDPTVECPELLNKALDACNLLLKEINSNQKLSLGKQKFNYQNNSGRMFLVYPMYSFIFDDKKGQMIYIDNLSNLHSYSFEISKEKGIIKCKESYIWDQCYHKLLECDSRINLKNCEFFEESANLIVKKEITLDKLRSNVSAANIIEALDLINIENSNKTDDTYIKRIFSIVRENFISKGFNFEQALEKTTEIIYISKSYNKEINSNKPKLISNKV